MVILLLCLEYRIYVDVHTSRTHENRVAKDHFAIFRIDYHFGFIVSSRCRERVRIRYNAANLFILYLGECCTFPGILTRKSESHARSRQRRARSFRRKPVTTITRISRKECPRVSIFLFDNATYGRLQHLSLYSPSDSSRKRRFYPIVRDRRS